MALSLLKGMAPIQKLIAPLAAMPTTPPVGMAASAFTAPLPGKQIDLGLGFTPAEAQTSPYDAMPQKSLNVAQDYGWFGMAPSTTAQPTGTAVNGTGAMASLGGDWAGVDRWNTTIQQAAAQTGVPANLIKAIMKVESNGDPNATGAPGVWGPMQVYGNVWGDGPWMHDPDANIIKGAEILRQNYDQYGSWDMAIQAYLGFGTDMYGTTNTSYRDAVTGYWKQLDGAGSLAGTGIAGGGQYGAIPAGATSLTSMFGAGAGVPDWGEFNAPSDLGYYTYGAEYGLSGTTHTGVDVPLNPGTSMFAPFSGHVVCASNGWGTGEDSCDAFACQGYCPNGSAGRIEIMSDDGNTILIFGHASGTSVTPGQRVSAGTLLGTSGGMNSGHVHLEARVKDPSTNTGWRIVDPRTVLGGGGFATQGGGGFAPAATTGGSGSGIDRLLAFMHR